LAAAAQDTDAANQRKGKEQAELERINRVGWEIRPLEFGR